MLNVAPIEKLFENQRAVSEYSCCWWGAGSLSKLRVHKEPFLVSELHLDSGLLPNSGRYLSWKQEGGWGERAA